MKKQDNGKAIAVSDVALRQHTKLAKYADLKIISPNNDKKFISTVATFLQRYKSAKRLEKDINLFFEHCVLHELIPTISGLCAYINTTQKLLFGSRLPKAYRKPLQKAKILILALLEQRLMSQGTNTSGIIFYLKNAYKWSDNPNNNLPANANALIVQTVNYTDNTSNHIITQSNNEQSKN